MIKASNFQTTTSFTPKVSIILPVYNVENYLDRCFASICNQSYKDFEVLVVDDGSTDSSGDICEHWAKQDDRIAVLHKQNGGLSDARNVGINVARGEYITCIDSDDYVTEDYIETLINLFRLDPACKMVGAGHYISRSSGNTIDYHSDREITVFTRREAFENVLYHGMVNVSAWAKMYHRSLFEKIRYPKGHLYEDTYIFGDLLNLTPSYIFSSKPVYYYCKREDSIVSGGYSSNRLEFIDSVNQLTQSAEKYDASLQEACLSRKVHANLSVLRYMAHVNGTDKLKRNQLRHVILVNGSRVLKDSKAPKRDKLAIVLLRMGFRPFYWSWFLYEQLR